MYARRSPSKLDAFEQKSLSAFSFAGTGMLLPPERMSEDLSCIVYPSDISGLVLREFLHSGQSRSAGRREHDLSTARLLRIR